MDSDRILTPTEAATEREVTQRQREHMVISYVTGMEIETDRTRFADDLQTERVIVLRRRPR